MYRNDTVLIVILEILQRVHTYQLISPITPVEIVKTMLCCVSPHALHGVTGYVQSDESVVGS